MHATKLVRIGRCERVVWVGLVGLALTLATAAARDPDQVGLSHAYHWAQKFTWEGCADCVLAGDSRVAYGVSPRAMAALWPDARVLNFAMAAGLYSDDYLDAIERVLDPASPCPTIVLGVTARSLLPPALVREGNGYDKLRDEAARHSAAARAVAVWFPFTSAIPLDRALHELNPFDRTPRYEVRYPDGWTAQAPSLADAPVQRAVARQRDYYARLYTGAQVDPATEQRVLARVRHWTARGIRVVGWRPPNSAALRHLEDRLSGFDAATFAKRFEQAGGTWLAIPLRYTCYDGSHLHRDAALDLSRDLARALAGPRASTLARR